MIDVTSLTWEHYANFLLNIYSIFLYLIFVAKNSASVILFQPMEWVKSFGFQGVNKWNIGLKWVLILLDTMKSIPKLLASRTDNATSFYNPTIQEN